jgi:hypothetical protein
VLLNLAGLILVGLSEFLEVVGRRGLFRRKVDILPDAEVSVLLKADASVAMTGGFDAWDRISADLN